MQHPQQQQEPSSILTGTTLGGRYLIGEVLGRGGWGEVYAATQQDLNRKVAIKILRDDKAGFDGDGLARFVREARAAAALGHPNIVQVTDFQTNPGEPPFLVMEHLTGQTLGTLLRRERRLPQRRVCAIAAQALAALDVAHRAGIVHRDVKPDNLFLVNMPGVEDFVKLLDFGIAKLLSVDSTTGAAKLTEAGTLLGTPMFMAPEQVVDTFVEAPADIYSLGATMYFALAGKYPLEASNVTALLYAIAHTAPVPLTQIDPSIDPHVSAIVHRAMAKDPHARWSSASEMRAALEPFVVTNSGHPAPPRPIADTVTSSPTSLPSRTRTMGGPSAQPLPQTAEKPKSNVVLFVMLGLMILVLLIVLMGGGGYLYYVSQHQQQPVVVAPTATTLTTPSVSPSPSPTTPTPTPTPTPSSKSSPKAVDAGAPAPQPSSQRVAMTGRRPRISGGGGFEDIGLAAGKAEVTRVLPLIANCHAQTEFDPPSHEDGSFVMVIDPAGTIRDVRTFGASTHPKYEACVFGVLRQLRYPATASGAKSAKIFFTARIGE